MSEAGASVNVGFTANNTDTSGGAAVLFNINDANKGRIKADNAGTLTLNGSGFAADITISSAGVVTITNLTGTGSRNVVASAAGVLSAPVSDARLKTNVNDLQGSLNKVLALRGASFDFIPTDGVALTNDSRRQIGMIADEVEKVIPEAVGFNAPINGVEYRYINYDTLIPVLIEAIKELQAQVNELRGN